MREALPKEQRPPHRSEGGWEEHARQEQHAPRPEGWELRGKQGMRAMCSCWARQQLLMAGGDLGQGGGGKHWGQDQICILQSSFLAAMGRRDWERLPQ